MMVTDQVKRACLQCTIDVYVFSINEDGDLKDIITEETKTR